GEGQECEGGAQGRRLGGSVWCGRARKRKGHRGLLGALSAEPPPHPPPARGRGSFQTNPPSPLWGEGGGEGPTRGTTMLKVDGINQYYGGSHILRNVGFDAKLGEVTVILGRNGVGKTTPLKSLMGVVPGKTGPVQPDGRDIPR